MGPALFSVEAVLLTEPHCQRLLLQAFAGSTVTPALAQRLTSLLRLLALMQIFDCLQYSMQGVVQVDPCALSAFETSCFAGSPLGAMRGEWFQVNLQRASCLQMRSSVVASLLVMLMKCRSVVLFHA